MKKFLILTGGVGLMLALIWFLAPRPEQPTQLTDMPWQIEPQADGTAKVLGIHLGQSTLADAITRYGRPEGLALFVNREGNMSLEAFFDSIKSGPLSAKLILTLQANPEELKALAARALTSEASPSGDHKILLAEADKPLQAQRLVRSITYIPGFSGLDADFFRPRFGEPKAWQRNSESSVSWYYPDRGLSILIDAEGKEMLQYEAPRDYRGPTETPKEGAEAKPQ